MAKRTERLRVELDREPRTQYAALPWRRTGDGEVEILLITSRETRRWVIPKGWPIRGKKPGPSAAREAFEEAGVEGEVSAKPVGVFHYDKRLRSGRLQHIRAPVYALQVARELDAWPEKAERDREWVSPDEAAERVGEPELKALIRGFTP